MAAHSYLNGHRLANTKSIDQYVAANLDSSKPVLDFDEKISPELQLAETVILGLRLSEGICAADIQSRFETKLPEHYKQQFEQLADAGLLETDDNRIRLTRRGRLLGNEVFWRFLPD